MSMITERQRHAILAIWASLELQPEGLLVWCLKHFGNPLADLSKKQAEQAIAKLQRLAVDRDVA